MKDKMIKMKIEDLKFDSKLTELRPVNEFVCSRYRQAYRAGAEMPMIVLDSKTRMITSGNHRANALQQEYPPEYEVTVILRPFKNRYELLKDFVSENASHGHPLSGFSRRMIAFELNKLGAANEEIAKLLNVATKRLVSWADQVGTVKVAKNKVKVLPIKRGPHIKKPMTKDQYEEHKKVDRGVSFQKMAAQIVRWIDNDWIEVTNENMEMIKELKVAIDRFVKENIKNVA